MGKVNFPVILFLDGHTSHINVAVSEFCWQRKIILYCFPAHASHILQPLDVTVFGPLKKLWNKAIDEFKEEFKMPMTKANFFPAFDKAWKSLTGKKHAVSGFKATGLVPFNPNQVDYTKVLGGNSDAGKVRVNASRNIDRHNQVGIYMCLQKIESILPPPMLELYQRRFSEGYDVEDDANHEIPWNIYNQIRKMSDKENTSNTEGDITGPQDAEQNDRSMADADEAMSDDVDTISMVLDGTASVSFIGSVSENLRLAEQMHADTIDQTHSAMSEQTESSRPMLNESQTGSETSPAVCDVSFPNNPGPSTSTRTNPETSPAERDTSLPAPSTSCAPVVSLARTMPYDKWQVSPFKEYLKISDSTIITRKVVKTKAKTPPAFSGTVCRQLLWEQQQKKSKELELKEQRRVKRLEKQKSQAQANKKDNVPAVEDEVSDNDIRYADSSDDDIESERNCCGACEGTENWNEGNMWIGCESCPRWFHKACLSDDLAKMSVKELKKYEFNCPVCVKMNKNKAKKTKK